MKIRKKIFLIPIIFLFSCSIQEQNPDKGSFADYLKNQTSPSPTPTPFIPINQNNNNNIPQQNNDPNDPIIITKDSNNIDNKIVDPIQEQNKKVFEAWEKERNTYKNSVTKDSEQELKNTLDKAQKDADQGKISQKDFKKAKLHYLALSSIIGDIFLKRLEDDIKSREEYTKNQSLDYQNKYKKITEDYRKTLKDIADKEYKDFKDLYIELYLNN